MMPSSAAPVSAENDTTATTRAIRAVGTRMMRRIMGGLLRNARAGAGAVRPRMRNPALGLQCQASSDSIVTRYRGRGRRSDAALGPQSPGLGQDSDTLSAP